MKKEDIHLGDIQRILFGDTPAEFTLEVIVRTIIIYLIFLVIMRLFGKRMNGQLTITELSVMLTLGAIIAVPMQVPNRGLLPGAILLVCVLYLQRGLNWWSVKRRKVEVIVQGKVIMLAKNGMLLPDQLKKERVSHEQLFAELRDHKITHLGQVKRVYMEASGTFSVYKQEPATPSLSVLPSQDNALKEEQEKAPNQRVCEYCGNQARPEDHAGGRCLNCGHEEWIAAVC
ncbi:DUF421 domain-containing protein [Hymenobacter fodinae]|uniref:DUF421 domain-containing protein n=1 Tax=Hymenobacter fodinae TaxID=2510796 RepID=A0A4Z0P4S5_9BACT|nr:YetF domain-containing protein [Hymenobacter fodinae]TGE06655.1 DUF421 domain-containing protein [Hymenobacter fodinae]